MGLVTEASARTEVRLEQLTEVQARTESRLETLAGDVSQLTAARRVTEQTLSRLVESQGQMQQALTRLTIRTDSVVGRTLGHAHRSGGGRSSCEAGTTPEGWPGV